MSVDQAAPGAVASDPPASREVVVAARGVSKVYDDRPVLEGIELSIREGELYGIVGPSGCGKTTLIRTLLGLARPTEGEVEVRGLDPTRFRPRHRRAVGYLPQEFSLYPTLTVQQNARFMAGLYGIGWLERRRRIRELLTFLEIWDARKRLAQDLSGGMRRRLGLAAALLHRPSLLVVDEPTAGLDPTLRLRIWEYLEQIRRDGTTIILTTQHIEEAGRCDRVLVMAEGRTVASGSPDDLRDRAAIPDSLYIEVDRHGRDDLGALWQLAGVEDVRPLAPDRILVRSSESELLTPQLTETLTDRGIEVRTIEVQRPSFEDVFLQITNRT